LIDFLDQDFGVQALSKPGCLTGRMIFECRLGIIPSAIELGKLTLAVEAEGFSL
jgi:hypothetical protein